MTQRNLELFSRPFREGRGFWTWNCASSPDIGSRELCQYVQNWTELSITISRLARTLLGSCLLRVCPAWELASFVLRPSKRPKLAFALWSRGRNSVFRFSRFWIPEPGTWVCSRWTRLYHGSGALRGYPHHSTLTHLLRRATPARFWYRPAGGLFGGWPASTRLVGWSGSVGGCH